jgi:2-oxoglutarate ferredoxin oxidoreductase subunit beta
MTDKDYKTGKGAMEKVQINDLTRKDFETSSDVRWCPGCGDFSVLKQVQMVLPKLGIPRENFAFISGIGCSSRFPYYMETYGMHSIHGRATAIATGLKISRPELSVWVVTGDGDALAIGGNHFIHTMRRNVDMNILLLNNQIYGLTKGQASPTTQIGKATKTSPVGSIDRPVDPVALALSMGATFVARAVDIDQQNLRDILERAAAHKGTSLVEIYQNCHVFNDGAFEAVANKKLRDENRIMLEHGKPLIFGKDRDKGIVLSGLDPEVVSLADGKYTEADLLVHDEKSDQTVLAYFLSRMKFPEFPVPMGVFRATRESCYGESVRSNEAIIRDRKGPGNWDELMHSGGSWVVK